MFIEYDTYQKKIRRKLLVESAQLFILIAVIETIFFQIFNYADGITRVLFVSYIVGIYYLVRKYQVGVDLSPISHFTSPFFSKRIRRITLFFLILIAIIYVILIMNAILSGNIERLTINGRLVAFRSDINFTTPMLMLYLALYISVNAKITKNTLKDLEN